MTADETRAAAYLAEQRRIEAARKAKARALLAPAAGAAAVKAAWAPVGDWLRDRRSAGGA